MSMIFKDRQEAGRKLSEQLSEYAGRDDVLLFALPRGGVVTGAEIAKALGLSLGVIVTRKIGAPYDEEFAIGALSETGESVWNDREKAANDSKEVDEIVAKEKIEAKRRIDKYRGGRRLPSMTGKTVIIVDDGIATGLTMKAAIEAAKHQGADKIVVAVPHGAKDTIGDMRKSGVVVVALSEPESYGSVGQYYEIFPQTEDEEVIRLLSS
jgi:putative phosphoribosyl transferase